MGFSCCSTKFGNITCWSKVMLKSTNPNHHGHDNRGTTGTREYNSGFGVLSENNQIMGKYKLDIHWLGLNENRICTLNHWLNSSQSSSKCDS